MHLGYFRTVVVNCRHWHLSLTEKSESTHCPCTSVAICMVTRDHVECCYFSVNPSRLSQAAGVGQHRNLYAGPLETLVNAVVHFQNTTQHRLTCRILTRVIRIFKALTCGKIVQ